MGPMVQFLAAWQTKTKANCVSRNCYLS